MTAGILGTAVSGLMAAQSGLQTTSNNISNVNTEGYSRQRTEQATRLEQYMGGSFVGTGVNVVNIKRSYDQFVTSQVRSSSSAFGEVDQFYTAAAQIDNLLGAEGTSLAPALKSFFNAVHSVADDPTSIPSRQLLLSEGDSMAQSFNVLSSRFATFRDQSSTDMDNMVKDLNSYAGEIANLNLQIVNEMGKAPQGQLPNDLLDQRDTLINKIAKIVDVSVVPQGDGSTSIFIGKGQALVLSNHASTMSTAGAAFDASHKSILLDGQDITPQISGGSLYGSLRFRDEVLDPAQQQIGLLAAGLTQSFNNLHQQGYDLNGTAGQAFFDVGKIDTFAFSSAGAVIDASYQLTGASALVPSDLRLDIVNGPLGLSYTVTNLSDNTTSAAQPLPFGGSPNTPYGIDLSLSPLSTAGLQAGDSFLIRPTFNAAARLAVNPALTPDKIAAAGGFAAGPAGLPGDNRNVLALAQLENASAMYGGTTTFFNTYGQLVSDVGTQTHGAQLSRSAQDVLLKQATGAWESKSGVNLDEEAANLIKYQNAYQASAQAVSVANSLFDTLLGAVR